jgi:CRP-like cAMP-binding protein
MNLIDRFKTILDEQDLWEEPITLQRNEHLMVRGNINTHSYFVDNGSIRVYVLDEMEEHTIRFGYQGSFITALDSFFTDGPTNFYFQAIKQTELRYVRKEAFKELMDKDTGMAMLWRHLLEGLVIQQLEREQDLLTSSPLERYKRVLKRSPQLFQELPIKYIASYLRMSPDTLSRIKKS